MWSGITLLLDPAVHSHLSGPPLYAALLLIGLGIGVLTGFFGVGGGFLLVPLLNIVLGINYELAVGTSLCFIIGTSAVGLLKQKQHGNVHLKVAVFIVSGSLIGAVLGDSLQMYLLHGAAGGNATRFTLIMHTLFILLLGATAYSMKNPVNNDTGKLPILARFGPAPKFSLEEWGSAAFSVPGACVTGILIGISTGLLGIGGGILLVPVLLVFFGLTHQKAAGTSLAIIFATSVAAVLKKGFSDIPKISIPVTLVLLLTSIIGVQLGIFMVRQASGSGFRRYFIYVIILTTALIAADLIRNILSLS